MKMSEAIRKALTLAIEQIQGDYFVMDGDRVCACAAGQALIGAGIVTLEEVRAECANNLGVASPQWVEARVPDEWKRYTLRSGTVFVAAPLPWVVALNDDREHGLSVIAAKLEVLGG
jgi:hypothetical protein